MMVIVMVERKGSNCSENSHKRCLETWKKQGVKVTDSDCESDPMYSWIPSPE